jgi:hypothetical protein
MKKRPVGFLAYDKISYDSEIFDYIQELHEYLWMFIRIHIKSASGNLEDYLDIALDEAKYKEKQNHERIYIQTSR